MKLNTFAFAALAITITASSPAWASTDGALDAVSSVGTFTNTFGTTVPNGRKVQVLDLKDAAVTNATPQLLAEGATRYPGVRDNFCIVDNAAGGTVNVKFSNTNGAGDWVAKSITGADLTYRLQFAISTTAPLNYVPVNTMVAFKSTITEAAKCLTGNVSKGVTANNTITTNATHIDTVVVTVTPV